MVRTMDNISGGKVTIKDISAKLGISSTTVHRAIVGKEGMSDSLRQKILETAKEMGYEINYAASSIKRKPVRIAVILPADDGRYFGSIWNGVKNQAEEARRLNVEVEMIACEDEWDELVILKTIADAGPEEYAGVLAFSYSSLHLQMPEIMIQLQRLVSMKITTFVIDDEMHEPEGIYCIPACQKAVGELAAELTSLMTPRRGTVLVTRGRNDSIIHKQRLEAFLQYMVKYRPELNVVTIEGYSTREQTDAPVRKNILKALREYDDIVLYYAQTSGDTRVALNVFRELQQYPQFICVGTDLNTYTAQSIRDGELTLVIDQGGYMKGYMGLGALVDSVVKHIKPDQNIDTIVDVVYKSNLRFYERTKKLNKNGGTSK